ncbi:MAG: 3-deoxy-8-phosphooctulonate synthase [Deltaproteobacteria bacterium]|nr:3-deoxy-8-phosphooctulonate synthase [Deltaproteobacteria bacterium]
MKTVTVDNITIGGNSPFVLIAGPCVIEDLPTTVYTAERLIGVTKELGIPLVFKASYDKANRTSIKSYRGPGLERGLEVLSEVKKRFSLPILTDVHCQEEVARVAQVVDIIQIPAFLSRQTDLILEVARTQRVVNIKKGQFLAPWDMKHVVEKVLSVGNERIILTERGTSFGYNNLVVDFRSIPIMRGLGFPVVFDTAHSVQLPGGLSTSSGGDRSIIPHLARAALAVGVDAIFMEVHPEPGRALCDGPNSLSLDELPGLLRQLKGLDRVVKENSSQ